jgi:hypothetical protein
MTQLFRITAWMLAAWAAGAQGLAAGPSRTTEGGFRVDSKVFFGEQKEPSSQSSTIFRADAVYDYLDKPAEVVIFEKTQNRFFLVDTTRRLYTEIPADRVLRFNEELKSRVEGQKDPFLKFMVSPTFEEQFDVDSGVLSFSSPWLTYKVTTLPTADRNVSQQYREFADWYARLAPVLNPQARPPFARLVVNAGLAQRSLLPREVHLAMTPKRGIMAKRYTIRSEHQWIDRLGESDLNRVTQSRQFLAIFNSVSVEQYAKQPE